MAKLTGKRRYRKGMFGCLILQVEQVHRMRDRDEDEYRIVSWRDARIEDLTEEPTMEVAANG